MPNVIGGPRQKLLQVMRQSGVSDSAAVALANQALGAPADSAKKKRKKSDPQKLREAIIKKLKEIGASVKASVGAGPPKPPAMKRKG